MMECYRKIGIYDVANAVDILTRCGKNGYCPKKYVKFKV
jgi:hypothetical protein